jgi:hypothetical protein
VPIATLTAVWNSTDVTLVWRGGQGADPVSRVALPEGQTGFWRDADGRLTFVFYCPKCGRNPERRELKMIERIRKHAQAQHVTGRTAVQFDISTDELAG